MSSSEQGGPASSSLPIKLRFKQKARQDNASHHVNGQRDQHDVQTEIPKGGSDNGEPLVKASKIAGIAPKKGPRIGPEYQANIPEIQHK